jgi:hypothetical protein
MSGDLLVLSGICLCVFGNGLQLPIVFLPFFQ